MFDVLNAAFRAFENFAQCRLALGKWFAPLIVTVEHQQIKSAGDCAVVVNAAVQGIEIGHTIRVNPDNLGIQYRGHLDRRGRFDNQRIALGPIGSVVLSENYIRTY